jgi:hypothetical protein
MLAIPAWAASRGPFDNGNANVLIVPKGRAGPVSLRAASLEAELSESDGQIVSQASGWFVLQNSARQVVTITVALPGPQAFGAILPPDLRLSVDGVPLPIVAAADDPSQALATLTIAALGSVRIMTGYQQVLPSTEFVSVYASMLTALAAWPGRPDALRVQLRADLPPARVLAMTPSPDRTGMGTFTWDWSFQEPSANLGIALVAPGPWATIEAVGRSGGSPPSAESQANLAQAFAGLAVAEMPPFAQDSNLRAAFLPAALGELTEAVSTAGSPDHETLSALKAQTARTHIALAERSNVSDARARLESARSHLSDALEVGAQTEAGALRQELATVERQLAQLPGPSRSLSDWTAGAGLSAPPLGGAVPAPTTLPQSRAAALDALYRLDPGPALSLASAALSTDAQPFRPPLIAAAPLLIECAPTKTRLLMRWLNPVHNEPVASLLHEVGRRLESAGAPELEVGDDYLAFVVPSLSSERAILAQALPNDPEFANLIDVLAWSPPLTLGRKTPLSSAVRREARLDLSVSGRRLMQLAGERAPGSPMGIEPRLPADSAPSLGEMRLLLELARAEDTKAAWRTFALSSGVTFRFIDEMGAAHTWYVPGGTSRTVTASSSSFDVGRAARVAAATATCVLLAAMAAWLVIRRS